MDDSGKSGDTSGDGLGAQESKDTNHGGTAVVDLLDEASGLLLLRGVLAELEGVVKVEGDRVGDALGARNKVGVVTGLSAGHVVLVVTDGQLSPELKEANEAKDLPLGLVRDGVPKSRGVGLGRERGSVHLHGPRELDSVGVDNVSDEGGHGDTAVLDLGMTEETDGGLVGGSPELGLGEVQGIVELDNRVGRGGDGLKVSLYIVVVVIVSVVGSV